MIANSKRSLQSGPTASGRPPDHAGCILHDAGRQLAALSLRYAVAAVYVYRPFTAAGGLVSYGGDEVEYYRLVGISRGKYQGREAG